MTKRIVGLVTAGVMLLSLLGLAGCKQQGDRRVQFIIFSIKDSKCQCKDDLTDDNVEGVTMLSTVTYIADATVIATDHNVPTPKYSTFPVSRSVAIASAKARSTDPTKMLGITIKVDGDIYITCIGKSPGYVECATDLR